MVRASCGSVTQIALANLLSTGNCRIVKLLQNYLGIWVGVSAILCLLPSVPPGQARGVAPDVVVKRHEDEAARFKSGDTNVPMLTMHWFKGCTIWPGESEQVCTLLGCKVDKSGVVRQVSEGFFRISNSIGTGVSTLSSTILQALTETCNRLPSPPAAALPVLRQILISGVRSNQWFYAVYDRANIPTEVSKLFELTGTTLVPFPREDKSLIVVR